MEERTALTLPARRAPLGAADAAFTPDPDRSEQAQVPVAGEDVEGIEADEGRDPEAGAEDGPADGGDPQHDEDQGEAEAGRHRHAGCGVATGQEGADDPEPVEPGDRQQVQHDGRALKKGQDRQRRLEVGGVLAVRQEMVEPGEQGENQHVGERTGGGDGAVPPGAADGGVVDPDGAARQAEAADDDVDQRQQDREERIGVSQRVQRQVAAGRDRTVAGLVGHDRMAELVQAEADDPTGDDEHQHRRPTRDKPVPERGAHAGEEKAEKKEVEARQVGESRRSRHLSLKDREDGGGSYHRPAACGRRALRGPDSSAPGERRFSRKPPPESATVPLPRSITAFGRRSCRHLRRCFHDYSRPAHLIKSCLFAASPSSWLPMS